MKLKALAIVFAATGIFASVAANSAPLASGTVKFEGKILDAGCKVDVTTSNQTVKLGEWPKDQFTAADQTTAATAFTIKLTACPEEVTSAHVQFSGNEDATNPALLAVTGGATGVGINIMTADDTQLPINGTNDYRYTLAATPAENSLAFSAQYQSTAASVGAGDANGTADFIVNYN
ncbi:fimbrial protein [Kluyvera genomosp. 1]|uniref:fimbrial protein n=1 Tax=Kluyvera genomosp. 1 TaxID=2774053 RepID=UPI00068EE957|nr:fimbrial protein [Kluyvera genomosp. 1]